MKMLLRAALLLLAFGAASPSLAQSASSVQAPAGFAPMSAPCVKQPDGSCAPLAATVPVATTAAASCLVAKNAPGSLIGASLHSTAVGWFLILNATTAPADGAVTPIEFVRYASADVTVGYAASPPIAGTTGLTICFSTSGPYTLTKSATATISAKVM